MARHDGGDFAGPVVSNRIQAIRWPATPRQDSRHRPRLGRANRWLAGARACIQRSLRAQESQERLTVPPRGILTPVDLAGFVCAVCYGVLAWLAQQPGEPPLAAFLTISGTAALATFALYLWQGRAHATLACGPVGTVGRLVFWALVFRLCGLVGGPFYEDDFFRFLWDGYRFATDGTPYGQPPEAYFGDPSVPVAFQRVLDEINNPHLATIYGPVTQTVFLLGYALRPGSVVALQAVFIAIDLLLIGLLLRLAPARGVLLYAWCPLVVKEIAFTAHPDGLAVALLVAAVVASGSRRPAAVAICVGLAVAAKAVALLLAPLLLLRCSPRWWGLCAGVVALVYLPFVLQGASDLATLAVFLREWRFNAGLFDVLTLWLSDESARVLVAVALLGVLAWCRRHDRRAGVDASIPLPQAPRLPQTPRLPQAPPRGDWLFGAWLALSPVVNPWYLLWVLPFAAIYPSLWAWTASVAVLLAYWTGLNAQAPALHPYDHPIWVRPLEYGLILLLAGADLLRRQRRRGG